MSTARPEHDRSPARRTEGSGLARWRLWAAMLTLALVPTVAGIYLTTSWAQQPDPAVTAEHARQSSQVAANLLASEQAIEARLLVAAADPALARLANGIDGPADRQLAERVLSGVRGTNGAAISGACIVRSADGLRTPLVRGSSCLSPILRPGAVQPTTDMVVRSLGDEGGQTLWLATPSRSVSERNSGVLFVEVDTAALFGRSRMVGSDAVSSMLVDMGSSEVVAATPPVVGPADGAGRVDLTAVAPHLEGIVADDAETDRQLADMGLASTVVPLWGNDDGSKMGLVQLWPEEPAVVPFELRLAMLLVFASVIVVVIVLVRVYLGPLTDSRAELQELYTEAREEALNDGLTGLGNHRSFQEQLAWQMHRFEQDGTPFSLVLMDLDDLKLVNDRDGHATGDEVLVSMAQTMRDMSRRDDLPYRTGGDEFAMILVDTQIEEALEIAERILHFCKRPRTGARPSPFSAGISSVPRFARQRDLLYSQADAALYWAKRHGRGSIEVFDSERDRLPEDVGVATGHAVQEVITGKLLRPVFQPIVDLRSGHILGFEGLIRPDPRGPLPDTTRLFAAAAASGRTVELDLACIDAVIEGARAIGPDRLLTLNLSPRTLEAKDFDASWLLSSLVRRGISPSRVIIELTEREEVADLDRLQQTFNVLQQYGLRLAADDVGAGNSGLRLLSSVQFDIVKIDLTLVHDGVRRLGSRAVLESLRDLAVGQKAHIVAEGVETSKQLQFLRELDIGAGQGFLLGRPDASLEKTFVDVRGLESGLVVPTSALPLVLSAWPDAEFDDDEGSSEQRPTILLPSPKPAFRAEPGPA